MFWLLQCLRSQIFRAAVTATCADHRQRKKAERNMSVNYPFSALTPLFGRQEGHLACKKLDVGLLVVTLWLELCTS